MVVASDKRVYDSAGVTKPSISDRKTNRKPMTVNVAQGSSVSRHILLMAGVL